MRKVSSISASSSVVAACLGLSLLAAPTGVPAQSGSDRYWPCEQALVDKVPAAVVWDGPSVEAVGDAWRQNETVAGLAKRISQPRVRAEQGEMLIDEFAESLPVGARDQPLTELFAATLTLLNRDRSKLIRGIKRFARGQSDRAEHVSALLDEIVQLEDNASPEAQRRLAEIRETIEIQQRMFDEREQSIPFLCTRPVAVEQKLGRLARAISAHLD